MYVSHIRIMGMVHIKKTKITRKQKWKENLLYGHFKRQINVSSHEKTWT